MGFDMTMKIKLYVLLFLLGPALYGQSAEEVEGFNRAIDAAVVKKDMQLLRDAYSQDFVFTHGTGHVDSRDSWLKNVENEKTHYLSRDHDSTQVEGHGDVAIVTGKLSIARQADSGVARYAIRYVRVFVWRKKRWQMVSHRTVKQWNL